MAWAVGIEQTHKAIFDRRIEVVGKESFTMFQPDQCQHLFHSQLIIPQCFYQLKYSGIIGRELVRCLSGLLILIWNFDMKCLTQ